MQKLLEKSLIEIRGKEDTPGRPIIYGTSDRFTEYFGINSLRDLPTPKDFSKPGNEIGSGVGEDPEDQMPSVPPAENS